MWLIMAPNQVNRINNIVHGPEADIETDRRGIGAFLFDCFLKHGNKSFQINSTTGETENYEEFNKKCLRMAVHMSNRGIKKGDIVLLCSSNNMDVTVPIISTMYLNAITASLDPSLSTRDVIHLVNIVRPKMIITEISSLSLIEDSLGQLNFSTDLVVMGSHIRYTSLNEFLMPCVEEISFKPLITPDDSETAVIFFSSGSTGLPKAICCSHFGLLYGTLCLRESGVTAKVGLHFTSFYWISAIITTLLVIIEGGKRIVSSVFEAHSALKIIQDYKVTYVFLASTYAYHFSAENTAMYDTSNLEILILSGSSIGIEQMEKCKAYFPKTFVILAYGMTETSGFVSIFSKANHSNIAARKITSCGFPIVNSSIKIVDPLSEKLLGINEKGEIRILSKSLLNGYYKAEATENFDSYSYLKTGDIGYFDDNNCLYVCDRIKDMFKYKSWHIVPASIESVIYAHPAVEDAVVVGKPFTETDDLPLALVVIKNQFSNITEEELLTFVNERVLEREQLRGGIKIVMALPKTPTGKIKRRCIRDMVISGEI